ncbi:origin recognition complex subunit 2 [Echinococcus multilocularis]|uniref:Origin recognition complex subunit 2 n=1 Tax=Echinococcus multilocularis TaxID=6211 RepID=A0A068Y5L0_ECHMU|nr:origin recognition complex subunit 2 [Echinococcus multilocularis]
MRSLGPSPPDKTVIGHVLTNRLRSSVSSVSRVVVAAKSSESVLFTDVQRRSRSMQPAARNAPNVKARNPSHSPMKAQSSSKWEAIDDYFMKRSAKTSKRTLAKLRADRENGLPDLEKLEALLSEYHPSYNDSLEERLKKLGDTLLPHFRIYLMEGFNILLYGVGSKLELLSRLQKEYLNGDNCLVVSGYSPTVSIRKILNAIVDEVMLVEDAPAGVDKRLNLVIDHFSQSVAADAPLFLLINCIDGRNLRTVRAQAVLARLAAVPHIHIVATMDNVNLPILWSQTEVSRFSWIWEECTTLLPYSVEARFSSSRLLQEILGGSGNMSSHLVNRHLFLNPDVDVVALTRLRHVMASLPQNVRDIFRLLVEYQLQAMEDAQAALRARAVKKTTDAKGPLKTRKMNEEEAVPKGMPLEELYWRCRDAFLTNTEVALRAQLTEFKDHKLIKFSKGSGGTELLHVPLDLASLREIIENKEMFP